MSAQSYHSVGANVGMADESIRFVSDTIDCGNLDADDVQSGKSPYGVWGRWDRRKASKPCRSDALREALERKESRLDVSFKRDFL